MTGGQRRPRNVGSRGAPSDADQADARRSHLGRGLRAANSGPGHPASDPGPHAVTAGPAAAAVGYADELGALLALVARGDQGAYEAVFDRTAGQVLGVVLAVVRDPAQSE